MISSTQASSSNNQEMTIEVDNLPENGDEMIQVTLTNRVDELKKDQLKTIIKNSAFKHGDFTLSSGEKSDVFFDMKPVVLHAYGSILSADLIVDLIKDSNARAVGGMALGAIALTAVVCLRSTDHCRGFSGFYIRQEVKDHGTEKLIEGYELWKGDEVVIIDDVATTGNSLLKAINTVVSIGCKVVKVVVLVDREQGATELLAKEGYTLESIFKKSELE